MHPGGQSRPKDERRPLETIVTLRIAKTALGVRKVFLSPYTALVSAPAPSSFVLAFSSGDSPLSMRCDAA